MKTRFGLSTVLAILLIGPTHLEGQDSTNSVNVWIPGLDTLQVMTLTDGSEVVGRVEDDGDPIRFELVSGAVLEIRPSQIESLRVVEGRIVEGELWKPDPSSNRMFFGPTGNTINRGKGYFAVFEVMFPALGFGLTDRFSIAGGTLLIGDLGSDRPVWVIPKLQLVDQERFDLSVGALAVTTLDADAGSVGVLFGVGTMGSADASVTVGAGWGWVDDDLASVPTLLFGGETRVSKNTKLMTENYVISDGDGDQMFIFAGGPRFLGDRLSADIALAFTAEGGDSFFFPLVNFVWNW